MQGAAGYGQPMEIHSNFGNHQSQVIHSGSVDDKIQEIHSDTEYAQSPVIYSVAASPR